MQPAASDDRKTRELAEMVEEIRARVRARYPSGSTAGGVALADLTPLLHARDAAEGKVASIGTVNPRPPGLLNSTIQFFKRAIARALDWHVREQIEFNRAVMNCVEATLEALNETNRAIGSIPGPQIREELADTRAHWNQWRHEWERKLSANEIHFLRSVSELQAAFQHRVTLLEEAFQRRVTLLEEANGRALKAQHAGYTDLLRQSADEIQKKLWDDLARIRVEYESIIHAEIRLLRQRTALAPASVPARAVEAAPATVAVDWLKFAEKFRGAEPDIERRQRLYADRFRGAEHVLDIGCGRGELLEVLRNAGIGARGIDLSAEAVAICRGKGLDAEEADLFRYLDAQPDASLGGITCSQVVEHLPPARVPEFIALAQKKLKPRALLAIETPNPECLAIFATHFFLDPTHTRPLPPALLAFYLEEAGFGAIEIERLYPAVETMPSVGSLPADFRRDFFGSLDYAIFGRRLPG